MPAIAALVGVAVLSLAVADYVSSPSNHKGLSFDGIYVPIPGFGGQPTAKTSPGGTSMTPGPAGQPPVIGPNGLKYPLTGVLDRSHMPSAAYYAVMGGFVVNATWAELQPSAGGPLNTAVIDKAISQVRSANASGAHMGLKLRIFAGTGAPNWAKNLGGAPWVAHDPSSGASGTVGRFWTASFGQAYQALEAQLAARYDAVPEVREVVIARCMTIYDEPMIRQISDPASVANMLAAGYSVAADQVCQQQQIQAHAVWVHTRSDLSFNPYQFILPGGKVGTNEAFTESLMSYCRQVLGARCTLENNSLRSSSLGGNYSQMYSAMKSRGPNMTFQTATMARIGSLMATLSAAVSYGAASVELPNGYQSTAPGSLALPIQQLAANAHQ